MKMTLSESLTQFEDDLVSRGYSAGYVSVTMSYVRRFNPQRGGPSAAAVTRYFSEVSHLSQSARNHALISLRAYLRFLERRGDLRRGQADELLEDRKVKRATRKPKHYIGVDDFPVLLEVSGRKHPSERAAVAVALYTLARQGEIATIRLKDVNLKDQTLRIRRHKRARWSDVTICPELGDELAIWLSRYAQETGWPDYADWTQLGSHHPDWYLIPRTIPSRNGGTFRAGQTEWKLDPEQPVGRLESVVKGALTELGAKTESTDATAHIGEGMHTIRRSAARAMFDHLTEVSGSADKALIQVMTMLDHEEPKMTLLYMGVDIERDRLNDYLRHSSPFGTRSRKPLKLVKGEESCATLQDTTPVSAESTGR